MNCIERFQSFFCSTYLNMYICGDMSTLHISELNQNPFHVIQQPIKADHKNVISKTAWVYPTKKNLMCVPNPSVSTYKRLKFYELVGWIANLSRLPRPLSLKNNLKITSFYCQIVYFRRHLNWYIMMTEIFFSPTANNIIQKNKNTENSKIQQKISHYASKNYDSLAQSTA